METSITLTLPNAHALRLSDAIAGQQGIDMTGWSVGQKTAMVKQHLKEIAIQITLDWEKRVAASSAAATAAQSLISVT
jgi:hypothetical protein